MSWTKSKLSEVATLIRGVTFSKAEGVDNPENGRVPVIRAGSIQKTLLVNEGQIWVPKEIVKTHQLIRDNDILMCTSSGSADLVGKCAKSDADYDISFGAFCAGIRPDLSKVSPSYLYHFLCSPAFKNWTKNSSGANIKNIRASELAEFEIPLPPLEEQKRIAAILDKADAIRQKRKQAIELADEFLRSVFLDMFGDPVSNPKGWAKKELNCLLRSIDSGKSLKCESRVAKDSEWGILKVSAVTSGKYKNNENKAFLGDARLISKYEVKAGDLLFTRKNTHKLVAAVSYVFETEGKKSLPDLIFRLNIKDENELSSVYLHGLLACSSQRAEIQALAGGAAGSMPNISKANLSKILLPVPDIKSQKKYEEIVYKHRKLIKDLSFAPKYDSLFNALSQKAFSGQL